MVKPATRLVSHMERPRFALICPAVLSGFGQIIWRLITNSVQYIIIPAICMLPTDSGPDFHPARELFLLLYMCLAIRNVLNVIR